jgi:hypothetical protein
MALGLNHTGSLTLCALVHGAFNVQVCLLTRMLPTTMTAELPDYAADLPPLWIALTAIGALAASRLLPRARALVAVAAVAFGSTAAQAQTAPVELVVSSPLSTSGTFGLSIRGATPDVCATIVAKTTLDDGGAVRFRVVRDCQYVVCRNPILINFR